MTIQEFENKLQENDLLSVSVVGGKKNFVCGEAIFNNTQTRNNFIVFWIRQDLDGRYNFFIADANKYVHDFPISFETVSDACDTLYRKICRMATMYQNT